ncbi:MAG: serine/threonine-protein kinase [Spirulinaceae cyanobacterium]
MSSSITTGEILSDRYRILRQLSKSKLGHTYLAKDVSNGHGTRILKELVVPGADSRHGAKAEKLLHIEFKLLHQLKHPQIPSFRELFHHKQAEKKRLFLVQDYVEGHSYRTFLETHKSQGHCFDEEEVITLFKQILPLLQYIHNQGVIHGCICPDNILLRTWDLLPVLIDFGGIRKVVANISSQNYPGWGKLGYAPPEQRTEGVIATHSDLYALGVTALVLLTGKLPQQLFNRQTSQWDWEKINLTPQFQLVLKKMLSQESGDRYQEATEVLHDLDHPPQPSPQNFPAIVQAQSSYFLTKSKPVGKLLGQISLLLLLIASSALIGWFAGRTWIEHQINKTEENSASEDPKKLSFPDIDDAEPQPSLNLSSQERQRKQELREKRLNLGINYDFYLELINQQFWQKYPAQEGRILTEEAEYAQLRANWDKIASETLEELAFLSPEARRGLGKYREADRQGWQRQANELNLSSKTLFDLADGEFLQYFPQQAQEDFLDTSIGQIWHGIVLDKLKALQSGQGLEKISLTAAQTSYEDSKELAPGGGQVYIGELEAGEFVRVDLTAPRGVLFSIYPPAGGEAVLEDSLEHSWWNELSESGVYEFVVVSQAGESVNYQLDISVTSRLDK